jgi:hypothetical protein
MRTKKQNRRALVRTARRVLNKTLDTLKFVRNGMNKTGWNRGLSRSNIIDKNS